MGGPFLRRVNVLKKRDFIRLEYGRFHLPQQTAGAPDAPSEGGFDRGERSRVVDGAQWLKRAAGSRGRQGVGSAAAGVFQKPAQEAGADARHIAGENQIPIGGLRTQRGKDGTHRAGAGVQIGEYREAEMPVPGGIADQGGVAGGLRYLARNELRQRGATQRQQGLVAAHPRAATAHQNETGLPHREIIASAPGSAAQNPLQKAGGLAYTGDRNIFWYICFFAAALFYARALAAAPPPGSPPAGTVVSVVRADPRTGKLVRKVSVVGGGTPEMKPVFRDTVARIAGEQAVPEELLHSVIRVESGYNPYAVSAKGALGLMQLVPATAKRFGVEDAFDPAENVTGGARYLKYLLDLYGGNFELALAAYNAGEGAVARYGGVPPFAETRQYVKDAGRALRLAKPAPAQADAPRPAAAEAAPRVRHIREIVEPDGSVRYVAQ